MKTFLPGPKGQSARAASKSLAALVCVPLRESAVKQKGAIEVANLDAIALDGGKG
ncbi:hypothetical protein [Desulfovulcanus sp.]